MVCSPDFVYDFSRKMILTLYFINQISFPDCLYFFICWSVCVLELFLYQAVTSKNFESTLSFQSSRFSTCYLENGKSFKGKMYGIFIIF